MTGSGGDRIYTMSGSWRDTGGLLAGHGPRDPVQEREPRNAAGLRKPNQDLVASFAGRPLDPTVASKRTTADSDRAAHAGPGVAVVAARILSEI
jgi:hypothetical protein